MTCRLTHLYVMGANRKGRERGKRGTAVESIARAKGVQSAARVLDVLSCFTTDHLEWGVSEIAAYLGLVKSAAHRFLQTLEQAGYVDRTSRHRYRLGVRALEMGKVYRFQTLLLQAADKPTRTGGANGPRGTRGTVQSSGRLGVVPGHRPNGGSPPTAACAPQARPCQRTRQGVAGLGGQQRRRPLYRPPQAAATIHRIHGGQARPISCAPGAGAPLRLRSRSPGVRAWMLVPGCAHSWGQHAGRRRAEHFQFQCCPHRRRTRSLPPSAGANCKPDSEALARKTQRRCLTGAVTPKPPAMC